MADLTDIHLEMNQDTIKHKAIVIKVTCMFPYFVFPCECLHYSWMNVIIIIICIYIVLISVELLTGA